MTTNEIILTIIVVASIVSITSIIICLILIAYVDSLAKKGLLKTDSDKLIGLMKHIEKIEKLNKSNENKLGVCARCGHRDAIWKTHFHGNVCNTCQDYMLGLD
jgi:hypothetical protein